MLGDRIQFINQSPKKMEHYTYAPLFRFPPEIETAELYWQLFYFFWYTMGPLEQQNATQFLLVAAGPRQLDYAGSLQYSETDQSHDSHYFWKVKTLGIWFSSLFLFPWRSKELRVSSQFCGTMLIGRTMLRRHNSLFYWLQCSLFHAHLECMQESLN